MFLWFLWPVSNLTERMFWITNNLIDLFYGFCHRGLILIQPIYGVAPLGH